MGSWDSDYTADDLGLVDTATKAATVIDTRIIPFSSRMSCELQVCSWENEMRIFLKHKWWPSLINVVNQ